MYASATTRADGNRRPRVISMFSGMEATSVAAHPLGWEFVAFSEVDPAACWTLHHHYGCGRPLHLPRPEDAATKKEAAERAARIKGVAALPDAAPGAPVNLGDMTQVDWSAYRGQVDIVVGGPPCQAFSFAGLRKSMDDSRGNLSLAYVRAIHAIRPLWSFTENVPGWLTTKDNAFGCYLGALVGADTPLDPPDGKRWGGAGVVDGPLYRAAWRVLDAQGFVPQRRRRVFVVAARVGTGGNPVDVLFETEAEAERNLGERAHSGPLFPVGQGSGGHPEPRGEAWQGSSGAPDAGPEGRGGEGLTPVAYRVQAALSTAMTSGGKARAADEVDTARALDTNGGFAANQGGNVVLQGRGENEEGPTAYRTAGDGAVYVEGDVAAPLTTATDPNVALVGFPQRSRRSIAGDAATADGQWIPETATTIRARDAKGSPDSDCTQTLLAVRAAPAHGDTIAFQCQGSNVCAEGDMVGTVRRGNQHVTGGVPMVAEVTDPAMPRAVAFDVRNGAETGEVTATVQSHHRSYSLNAQPVVCVPGAGEAEPVFLHCNKGRPAGRKSAHVEMVTAKPIVETLTTDGHSQSAVAVPSGGEAAGDASQEPIAFSAKDYGGDAGTIAPTLRAAAHNTSHANSGSHVGVVVPSGIDEAGAICIHSDALFRSGDAVTPSADAEGRVRLRPPGKGFLTDDTSYALTATQAHAVVTRGPGRDARAPGGDGADSEAGGGPSVESYATETGQGFWSEREPSLRVSAAPTQPQTIVKMVGMLVRRLTPAECLSLQGFPRGYLDGVRVRGKPLPDGPRYKLCGNSWAVPVIHWVFSRLDGSLSSQHEAGERP